MGSRNPDRISLRERYPNGATVALMRQNRWEVISHCSRCQLQMTVRLDWIALISGSGTSLWNRKARCRRLLCLGVTEFHAKAPGMAAFEPLRIDLREPTR